MVVGKKYKVPKWILRKIPCGITRLNTLHCQYYWLNGLDRRKKNWDRGGFFEFHEMSWKPEYIIDFADMTIVKKRPA